MKLTRTVILKKFTNRKWDKYKNVRNVKNSKNVASKRTRVLYLQLKERITSDYRVHNKTIQPNVIIKTHKNSLKVTEGWINTRENEIG